MLDVSEMFLSAFLNGGEQEKAVTVGREDRMRLGIQPLTLGGSLRVGLLAFPARCVTGRYNREILRPRHPHYRDLGRILPDPTGRYQIEFSAKGKSNFTSLFGLPVFLSLFYHLRFFIPIFHPHFSISRFSSVFFCLQFLVSIFLRLFFYSKALINRTNGIRTCFIRFVPQKIDAVVERCFVASACRFI